MSIANNNPYQMPNIFLLCIIHNFCSIKSNLTNHIKKDYNIQPYLFTKKINTNFKLTPFKRVENDVNKTKYLPPVIKEWKNSVYNYNSKNTMNYPLYDLHLNSLIKGYFTMYFNSEFLHSKYISPKRKQKSLNKIFVSKAEVKHTSTKAVITIYVYNREQIILLKKLNVLKKRVRFMFINKEKLLISKVFNFFSLTNHGIDLMKGKLREGEIVKKLKNLNKEHFHLKTLSRFDFFLKRYIINITKLLVMIWRLRIKLNLNKHKFEGIFLFKLSKALSKYYGKKVEFNIVNLKSIAHNADIFTEILTSKIKKEKVSPLYAMKALLAKVKLPEVNRIIERGRVEKGVNDELVENRYKNNSLSLILNQDLLSALQSNSSNLNNKTKDSLNQLLYNIAISEKNDEKESQEDFLKIRDIILDNINYKNMAGARLRVKGRLTRRYRADRAIYKLRWKGGLKNIDSAFKGLSTVVFRGHLDSNVEKSILASKRRIGSFAVKGWFSSK